MAEHCAGSSAVGKSNGSSLGCTTSGVWWFAMNIMLRIIWASSSWLALSSCSGIYEMASRVGNRPKGVRATEPTDPVETRHHKHGGSVHEHLHGRQLELVRGRVDSLCF